MTTLRKFFPMQALLLFTLLLSATLSSGGAYEGVTVTVLKKATTTTNGVQIAYPATNSPEVTAALVEIPAGGETGWHMHSAPVYAYVLSGTLTVEMAQGERYTFNAGDAIIEVVDRAHNGRAVGAAPVKLAVFYMGVQGRPTSVKAAPPQGVAPGQ